MKADFAWTVEDDCRWITQVTLTYDADDLADIAALGVGLPTEHEQRYRLLYASTGNFADGDAQDAQAGYTTVTDAERAAERETLAALLRATARRVIRNE